MDVYGIYTIMILTIRIIIVRSIIVICYYYYYIGFLWWCALCGWSLLWSTGASPLGAWCSCAGGPFTDRVAWAQNQPCWFDLNSNLFTPSMNRHICNTSYHKHIQTHIYIYICIALHCIALHCIALHCIALHCIAWHDMTWHDMTWHDMTWHT